MGWTFTTFDWSAWSEWTRGSLTPERAAKMRTISTQEAEWFSPAGAQALEELVKRVATGGLDAAYRAATPPELAKLDHLVCALIASEQFEAEFQTIGHLDPWGWTAIETLARSLPADSPARHLLTGRRPADVSPPDVSSGSAYVIFAPAETASLATDLANAVRTVLQVKLAEWEVVEFGRAMAEIATEAGRGRAVFAHYG